MECTLSSPLFRHTPALSGWGYAWGVGVMAPGGALDPDVRPSHARRQPRGARYMRPPSPSRKDREPSRVLRVVLVTLVCLALLTLTGIWVSMGRQPGVVKKRSFTEIFFKETTPQLRKVGWCPREVGVPTTAALKNTSHTGPLLTGVVVTLDEVHEATFDQLVVLNCEHNVALDIMVANFNPRNLSLCRRTHERCAPLRVVSEPAETRVYTDNRVQRIGSIRDAAARSTAALFPHASAVMVVDLDLIALPNNSVLLERARRAASDDLTVPDGVCALGLQGFTFADEYYDTYATVLNDGSWVYPPSGRHLRQLVPPGQHEGFAVTHGPMGQFTQWDLARWFEYQGSNRSDGLVPVKSCFGGVAVYKPATFFDARCTYLDQRELTEELKRQAVDPVTGETNVFVFSDVYMKRPCEHVVRHYCLAREMNATFAVDPAMRTFWKGDRHINGTKERLENKNTWSPERENTIATFVPQRPSSEDPPATPVQMSRLETKDHRLRINETGVLVIEEKATGAVMWTPDMDGSPVQPNWYRTVLALGPHGELILFQQVDMAMPEHEGLCRSTLDVLPPHCRLMMWRTHAIGRGHYYAVLTEHGTLDLVDVGQKENGGVYWSSAWDMGNVSGDARFYQNRIRCSPGSGRFVGLPHGRCDSDDVDLNIQIIPGRGLRRSRTRNRRRRGKGWGIALLFVAFFPLLCLLSFISRIVTVDEPQGKW